MKTNEELMIENGKLMDDLNAERIINSELKCKINKAIEALEVLKSDRPFRDIEAVFDFIDEALEELK